MMMNMGKIFLFLGVVFIMIGLLWSFIGNFIGKLPGDFTFRKGNVTFHFPLMTSILISIFLTLLFYVFGRFR